MVNEEYSAEQYELPGGVGDRLRAAREAKGLSLAQLSAETRITKRHLELIEAGNFEELPARTYAIGFSRTYARMVGLDDEEIVAEVRQELSRLAPRDPRPSTFEPGDPMRVPSRRLAWFTLFAALVLLIGGSIFLWRGFLSPAGSLPSLADDAAQVDVAALEQTPDAAAAAPASGGEVAFTALEDGIWVRFYEEDGRQLMQKHMAMGERYVVPPDAVDPQLWTGRPDALGITVDGREVPRLAERQGIVQDVPISAQALLARSTQDAQPDSPTT